VGVGFCSGVAVAGGLAVVLPAGSVVPDALALAAPVLAAPPPAAFSNAVRWRRSSTSFSRTAGSIVADEGEPDVPTAPAVPDALAGSLATGSGPISAVRFAFTLPYESRHWVWVLINSLKLEIN
jgi:hypothetical protein